MEQLRISLTPTLAKFVQQQLKTGLYRDESEVVAEALRHTQENYTVNLKQLKKALASGLKDAAEGKWVDFDPKAIRAEIRAKRKAR
jgi:putative addiction module CopG family antidote